VSEYHRLAEVGILGADDRIELLDGQLVDMSPIGPRHALAVDALMYSLIAATAGRAVVRVQQPLVLDAGNEPQPDLTVVRAPWSGYPSAHPGPKDVFLVIEVADTTLPIDNGAKRELYARAGIPEYWIVDLTADLVRVHRRPGNGTYGAVTSVDRSGTLDIEALGGVAIPSAALFS
jgi:Uma2 family endonuclease